MSSLRPSLTVRWSGGSIKSKFSRFPKPKLCICRMTEAKFVRLISGSVNSGRLKSLLHYTDEYRPRRNTATAPLTLVCSSLRYRFNWQALYARAITIAGNTGKTAINHIANIRNSQCRFCHVSSNNNAPALSSRIKIFCCSPKPGACEQWQDFCMPWTIFFQSFLKFANLLLCT